jgi:tryptophan-rich sensory protein
MAIGSVVISTNNQTILTNIENLSNKLQLFNMKFESLEANTQNYSTTVHKDIVIYIVLLVIMSILFIILALLIIFNSIKNNISKYADKLKPKLLCKKIVFAVFWVMVSLSIIASIVLCLYSAIFDGKLIYNANVVSAMHVILFFVYLVIIDAISCFLISIRLKRQNSLLET